MLFRPRFRRRWPETLFGRMNPFCLNAQMETPMTQPLVSVIIPSYNSARFVRMTIESVLRQSPAVFELIVVDDGSTDDSAAIVQGYEAVSLIRQPNQGLSAARNAGLAIARGEYLVFLDADDLLLPGALETGLKAFASRPDCAFVYGHCQFIDAEGRLLPTPFRPRLTHDHYHKLLKQCVIQSPGVVMFRHQAVDGFVSAVNGAEDWELYLRISRHHAIHDHGQDVLQYRRHDANLSRNVPFMLNASLQMFHLHRELARGDAVVEAFCQKRIHELERELAGKRNLTRDLQNGAQLLWQWLRSRLTGGH